LSDSPELLKPNVEVTDSKLQTELGNLKAENEKLRVDYDALLESSAHVTDELRQEVQELRSQLETERVYREKLETELADLKQNSATASIDAPEPEHIEFLKRLVAKKDPLISSDLWQEIERLKERNRQHRLKISAERRESREKILDLEDWVKGLTRKIQEKQSRLDELEAQLDTEHADREGIEGERFSLKQNSAPAATLSEKLTPDAATILSQLRTRRKKSKTDLADLEAILEILES
jgi:DNA repair exonuclease SbcCD ATPase subunit